MMHEAVHFAASKNRWLNDVTGIIAGSIALLPYEPWKRSHLEHHKWSGNVEKDPVMAIINFFPTLSKASRNAFSFFWKVWFPMLACMQYSVFWMLAAKQYVEKPMSAKLLISLLAPVIMWTSLIALLPTTFSLQILLPAVLIYFVAVEVVNFPHHLQLPQYRGETKLAIWDQHKIARSCVYPKWFGRLVALNFNYHIEHHMFPDVPWYHLEALHKEVSASLQADYNTDPYFQWILENKVLPIEEVLRASNHTSQKEVA
jgi:acyl-lipid omega-6 desaturase (Delta-12 desaturase)